MRQLPRLVAETPIGTEAKVVYWRDGKTAATMVKVAELEQAEETGLIEPDKTSEKAVAGTDVPDLGLTVSGLSEALRSTYEIPENSNGVVVTAIKNGSPAAEQGLMIGDVIAEINQQPVKEAAQAKELIDAAKAAGKPSVLLLVDHQGRGDVRFVALGFKKPNTDTGAKNPAQPK